MYGMAGCLVSFIDLCFVGMSLKCTQFSNFHNFRRECRKTSTSTKTKTKTRTKTKTKTKRRKGKETARQMVTAHAVVRKTYHHFLHYLELDLHPPKDRKPFASFCTYLIFDRSMMVLVLCQIKTSDQKELNMEALMRGLGRQMEGHHLMQTQPLQRLHMKPSLFQENKLIFLEIQCSQMGC